MPEPLPGSCHGAGRLVRNPGKTGIPSLFLLHNVFLYDLILVTLPRMILEAIATEAPDDVSRVQRSMKAREAFDEEDAVGPWIFLASSSWPGAQGSRPKRKSVREGRPGDLVGKLRFDRLFAGLAGSGARLILRHWP